MSEIDLEVSFDDLVEIIPDFWRNLALRSDTGTETLTWLLGESRVSQGSDYLRIRKAVAGRRDLTSDLIETLMRDQSRTVRAVLAGNKYVAMEYLERLADDEYFLIRARAAENPAASQELLSRLANDSHVEVRRSASWNVSAQPEVLSCFMFDDAVGMVIHNNADAHLLRCVLLMGAESVKPRTRHELTTEKWVGQWRRGQRT